MKIEHTTHPTPLGQADWYKLTNAVGASVTLSSLGAGIVSIVVPDQKGQMVDVALGYPIAAAYIADGPCAGKTPGRYANRIARGHLEIDGKTYSLPINNGPNHLHGGPEGFQNRIWESRVEVDKVVFTRTSPDGEAGYPGRLDVKVTYRWNDDNSLRIDYEAVTDAPTVVNLTNHTYVNLGGHAKGTALDHTLQLNSSRYVEVDSTLIPTGATPEVHNTPMDFREAKPIRRDINADFAPLHYGKGYDHCWLIEGWEQGKLSQSAQLIDPESGRRMTIFTTQPAMQVYTGNWLEGSPIGKDGKEYHDYDCVAIECQGVPDAPHHPEFPSQLLRPGETYRQTIIFEFDSIR